jgi:hypothetical protein
VKSPDNVIYHIGVRMMLGTNKVNALMHKTYELICQLPAHTASERIERLLSKEGVKYTATDLGITSVRTPMVVLGIQPELYSHSNWVGLNPFVFVSGVALRFKEEENGRTTVTVRVNRLRALLWVAFWITCGSLAALAMPEPGGAILFIGIACAAWFGIVSFLGGYLIKKEISDRLNGGVDDQLAP